MGAPSKKNLGRLISVYRNRQFSWGDIFTLLFPGILAVFIPLLYGIYLLRIDLMHHGPYALYSQKLIWIFCSALAFVLFAGLLIYRFVISQQYVAIYQEGIRIASPAIKTFFWSQFEGIACEVIRSRFININLNTRARIILQLKSGKSIQITSTNPNNQLLIAYLKEGLYSRIQPLLRQSYSSGQWLHFGPVDIYQEGLRCKKSQFQWADIKKIFIQEGRLIVILSNQTQMSFPVSQILNPELLLDIIQWSANR